MDIKLKQLIFTQSEYSRAPKPTIHSRVLKSSQAISASLSISIITIGLLHHYYIYFTYLGRVELHTSLDDIDGCKSSVGNGAADATSTVLIMME
jgi:hypothetical protein